MDNKIPEIMELFDRVVEIIGHGSHMPFSSKVSVPEDELLDVLDQMRSAIPEEVERAGKILADSEQMLADAQSQAEAIVAEAEEKAEQIVNGAMAQKETLLNQDAMVREAEAIAKELKENSEALAAQIKQEADTYSTQTRGDALKYANDVLGYLEGTLKSAMTSISGDRNNVVTEMKKFHKDEEEKTPEEKKEE